MAARIRALLVLLVALSVGAAVFFVGTSPAAAGTSATPGIGITVTGTHVGEWNQRVHGKLYTGFCGDFSRAHPDGSGISVVNGRVFGESKVTSARIILIGSAYHATTSKFLAAAAQLTVWKLRSESSFNRWYASRVKSGAISHKLAAKVNWMLNWSKTHGPYTVSVKFAQPSAGVGETNSGTVTVLGSNGKPATGRSVVLTASNAVVVPKSSASNSHGVVDFTATVSDSGPVNVVATITSPSSNRTILTQPSAGRQRLLVGGFVEKASGGAGFERQASGTSVSTVCSTNCDGNATVTVSACNDSAAKAQRRMASVGGTQVVSFDVPASGCGQQVVNLTDGAVLSFSLCYLDAVGGSCTSKVIVQSATYEVVCPAWAKATEVKVCDCPTNKKTVKTTASVPASPRYYRVVVTINGQVAAQADLTGTQSADLVASVAPGDVFEVRFTAYRDAAHTLVLADQSLDKWIQA